MAASTEFAPAGNPPAHTGLDHWEPEDGAINALPMAGTGGMADAGAPLGLYIHIPFCERKCPYCDFNTYAGLQEWFRNTVDALCSELALWQSPLAERTVTTLFIGGGTPTVLEAAELERLFAAIHRNLRLDPAAEITCEANPGTVDRAKFQVLRELGVNRLSLGVQSFQPSELAFLGRIHNVEDVTRAFAAARTAGFDNINLDFIFGLPHQSAGNWAATLAQALALAPEHLSLYSLIVEPNTPLNHWVATGQVDAPDEDRAGELYELALEQLDRAGYRHYEVSNWARPQTGTRPTERRQMERRPMETRSLDGADTPALACRHNLLYWRNQEYVGIGPGAHSHLCLRRRADTSGTDVANPANPFSRRWSNRKSVPGYVMRMRQGASVVDMQEDLASAEAMGESMMLGLRLVQEGVPLARFEARHGADLRQVYTAELDRLTAWGLVTVDAERVRLTPRGLMVGNQVFAAFLN